MLIVPFHTIWYTYIGYQGMSRRCFCVHTVHPTPTKSPTSPLDRRGGSPLTASYSKYFYLFIYVLPELKRIYLCYKKKFGGLPGT